MVSNVFYSVSGTAEASITRGASMRIVSDLVAFGLCLTAFLTGVVIAAAKLLIE